MESSKQTMYNQIDTLIFFAGWENWKKWCDLFYNSEEYVDSLIKEFGLHRPVAWTVYLAVKWSCEHDYLFKRN